MSKEDYVTLSGEVIDALHGCKFEILLTNGAKVVATLSGKLKMNMIKITIGDKVDVDVSIIDPKKGIITWRK